MRKVACKNSPFLIDFYPLVTFLVAFSYRKRRFPMFLSKHSNGIYYLWFMNEQGKKQKVSTHCRYKPEALKFLQGFKPENKVKRKLCSEYFEEFIVYAEANFSKRTVAIYRYTLKQFISLAGDKFLIKYTSQDIDLYKTLRQKPITVDTGKDGQKVKAIKPVTVNIELWTLRAFFNTAVRWELLESTPTFRTKAGRMRIIPLNDTSLYLLQSRQRKDTSGYVFSLNGKPLFADWITHLFKRYVRAANLTNQNLHFHSLRHTFASWLAQDGTSIYVIKDFLGHSDIKTTAIYSHLQPTQLHSEINKISISLN
jgi:site-specific recombinase XerD